MDPKKANGHAKGGSNEWRVKVGLAEMLKGGVIMDVTNAEQAKIAEKAGACAVMALERVPSDIRKEGGVARMASIKVIREIMATVTIPVMAKVRRAQPGRSAAAHRRRRGHDPHKRRGRVRQCRRSGAPHAHHHEPDAPAYHLARR